MASKKEPVVYLYDKAHLTPMVVRGTQIQVKEYLYLEGKPSEVIAAIKYAAEKVIDPYIQLDYDQHHDETNHYMLGWREMTEAEQKKADKLREANRAKVKHDRLQKEASELAEYERLKKKYG